MGTWFPSNGWHRHLRPMLTQPIGADWIWTPRGGALRCDATLVSPQTRNGQLQPCAAATDSTALRMAERRRRAAYPELSGPGSWAERSGPGGTRERYTPRRSRQLGNERQQTLACHRGHQVQQSHVGQSRARHPQPKLWTKERNPEFHDTSDIFFPVWTFLQHRSGGPSAYAGATFQARDLAARRRK